MKRVYVYAILAAVLGIGSVFLLYKFGNTKFGDANPFDVAMFLLVIAGAAIALVAQEFQARIRLAEFRKQWVEELRIDIVSLSEITGRNFLPEKRHEVAKVATKILVMINRQVDLSKEGKAHHCLAREVESIAARHGVELDLRLISATRAVLKQAWDQAVNETR